MAASATPSKPVLEAIAREARPNVPLPVVLAIGERESGFNPHPPDGSAGEKGMFQLLPKTVREELRYTGPLEALYDPVVSARLANQYLDILFRRFGTWPVAIRAWNGSGSAARDYAAGVLSRLPAWDQFVNANRAFIESAAAKAGAGLLVLAGAVALAFVMLRGKTAEPWLAD